MQKTVGEKARRKQHMGNLIVGIGSQKVLTVGSKPAISFFFFKIYYLFIYFIYLFLAVLGLSCGMRDLSLQRGLLPSCGVRVFSL